MNRGVRRMILGFVGATALLQPAFATDFEPLGALDAAEVLTLIRRFPVGPDPVPIANGWFGYGVPRQAKGSIETVDRDGERAIRIINADHPGGVMISLHGDVNGQPAALRSLRQYRVKLRFATVGKPEAELRLIPLQTVGTVSPEPASSEGGLVFPLASDSWETLDIGFASGQGGPFRLILTTRATGEDNALDIAACSITESGPYLVQWFQAGYAPPQETLPVQWINARELDGLHWRSGAAAPDAGFAPDGWTFHGETGGQLLHTNFMGSEGLACSWEKGNPSTLSATAFSHGAPLQFRPDWVYALTGRAASPAGAIQAVALVQPERPVFEEATPAPVHRFAWEVKPEWTEFSHVFSVKSLVRADLVLTMEGKGSKVRSVVWGDLQLSAVPLATPPP